MTEIIRSASIVGSRPLSRERGKDTSSQKTAPKTRHEVSEEHTSQHGYSAARVDENEPQVDIRSTAGTTTAIADAGLAAGMLAALQKENGELQEKCGALQDQLAVLQQRLNEGYEERLAQGYDAGFQQGQTDATRHLEQRSKALADVVASLESAVDQQISDIDELAAELGFAAFIRLVGNHFGDEKFVQALVKNALDEAGDVATVNVHVSDADLATINKVFQQDDSTQVKASRKLTFCADPRVQLGGCILESASGNWDARLETQIKRLKEAITSAKARR